MTKTIHYTIHEVAPYINWLYFFHAWGFPARLASISKVHGCEACRLNWLTGFPKEERSKASEAIKLFDEAQKILKEADSQIHTHAQIGLYEANSQDDDIIIIRGEEKITIPFLRQQTPGSNSICLCMSDFVRPFGKGKDKIGIFACSVDPELENRHGEDEYQHLLHQTIADRLAEATAERMHEWVRKDGWGFSPQEAFTIEELFHEAYQGKRPAVGYPSMPDQSINFLLDDIIGFNNIGITLTESGAMRPHASTSGLILSHPQTIHFSVGRIEDDQLRDYAKRRNISYEEMKKFIS